MKNLIIIATAMLIFSACQTTVTTPAADSSSSKAYTVPEDSAITKAVHDAYAAISFKKGEKPRYSEIGNYFIPQAQLINFRTDTADVTSLTQFIELYKGFLQQTKATLPAYYLKK